MHFVTVRRSNWVDMVNFEGLEILDLEDELITSITPTIMQFMT